MAILIAPDYKQWKKSNAFESVASVTDCGHFAVSTVLAELTVGTQ